MYKFKFQHFEGLKSMFAQLFLENSPLFESGKDILI
jgi:hypothetical protein